MGGTVAVVVIRVVEAIARAKKESRRNEHRRHHQQNELDIHKCKPTISIQNIIKRGDDAEVEAGRTR